MSHSRKNVPKRRFKGFNNTEGWEERKLGELGSVVMNRRIFKEETFYKGEIPFYKIGTFGGVADSYITREIFEDYKSKYPYPEKGDILISAAGSIGRVVEYKGEEAYYQDSNIVWLKHNKQLDNLFLKQFYSIVKWSGIEGTTIKRLYNKNILETEIKVPSINEQQNIGIFFNQLDNTIALHQRKLEKIKALKTAYLSEMFPAEGETKPKRRFAGFTDDWEQHKLGDLIDKQIKGKAQLEKLSKGTVAYLDTFTLNGGKAFLTDGHEDVVETDILILWDGSKAGTVYIGFKGALGSTLKGYRTSINEQFVYQFLKYNQENIYNNYRTPNIPHVQKDFLDVFKISIPKTVEQAKLGSFFQQLDKTITIHQRKLKKLQNIKKAYLNEMFI
ncbi:restriction endonuclease subunit S [Listeria monocytogenes]|uniref:restriction endonuclease subunit S n=1 Tax=Listeria monocytogenes TaxID=1639 RepID=UPI0011EB6665|nr:restriction endonuclease subunit S [Listeria monocytogenes]ECB9471908.1 restriction endonuclease subunit S [Listeria monocytogenes]ECB9517144.1 restriction endonuclease subunit S [Listeria monocytogenes]ECB9523069.1 restriction endonuclease subunit S [Listeria monocytogenes]ECB9528896.1 restriction endonuclease subunit S [Listeria monocytogenes]ECB9823892.1 restriction endonuclease subunit S [Listeria monocytogenes]